MYNLRRVLLGLQILVLMASCKKTDRADSYFDSLVAAQVRYLAINKPTVTKVATLDGKTDQSTFRPDSTTWENELDIFRQLSVFERSAYRTAYRVVDGIHDTTSNLVVRTYSSTDRQIPVPELHFYYYHLFRNLRRMEAVYRQENLLFSTTRRLSLEFDDAGGKPVLSAYRVEGIQKMILSDPVKFSIQTRIAY
jgi:hypothetical protein